METLNRIIISNGKNQYEFGGGSGQPADDSVDSSKIKNDSIQMEDLAPEVRKGLNELNNISLTDEDIENWFDDDPTNDDPDAGNDETE